MKQYLIVFMLSALAITSFGQVAKNQIQGRINFMIEPRVEFAKIAADYNAIGSLSGNIIFNNKIFFGGYVSKKAIPMMHTDFIVGQTNDISCQHLGINIGGNIVALKRKESYILRKSKIRATFGARIGGGVLWLNDDNWNKVSTRDYFYIAQAYGGFYSKLGTYVNFTMGGYIQGAYSIDKLNPYISNKDFLSPGVYVAFQIKSFK